MDINENKEDLLSFVSSPEELKLLDRDRLPQLAQQIRKRIISVVLENGGHLASNLGVVELTIAMHREFNSPHDMFFWDVGHQCYTHKLLTGRNDKFSTIRQQGGLSGFPKRTESIHDLLETGHASTSISAGIGALEGKRVLHDDGKVIVVVGDGALTGGMAYEGLNYAGHLGKDLIIIFNDNNMSISPNVGGLSLNSNLSKLSNYVSQLTTTPAYQYMREKLDRGIQGIPILGYKLYELFVRFKRAVKAAFLGETLFSELGFEYIGPVDGHSFSRLGQALKNARRLKKPVLLHVVTQKGKGYELAESYPSRYHGVSPLTQADGKLEKKPSVSFTEALAGSLTKQADKDERIVGVTAAMADGTGLSYFKEHFPDRFYDVGIAEQHAVTYSAGMAISGLKPVTAIYSTFMQRAVDQVIHDVALPGLPVVFAMDRSGLVGGDGETHQGLYDIPLFRSVPGLTFLAPGDANEVDMMLDWALQRDAPAMLRYPKSACPDTRGLLNTEITLGRGVMAQQNGADALLISVGGLFQEAQEAVRISAENGIGVDLYNLRFIKPIDEEYLTEIISRYSQVYMVEDGAVMGGIGEYVAGMLLRKGLPVQFRWSGVPDKFLPQASRGQLIEECKLDRVSIAKTLKQQISSSFSIVKPAVS
ncbi:MAG: 1-deoxy-D-xylulose-5-phosphate synthase [Spirochaetia bacterium]|nr:1-deoxy-D-xylulose-5-phosphate synthase [Spirochaetia bacterium]